jgi:hypothetical protein
MALLLVACIVGILYSFSNETKPLSKKNVQNHKVRFDAAKEQYFIVNELDTYDEPVTNAFGFRVMYKDKVKADFVCQKLNS